MSGYVQLSTNSDDRRNNLNESDVDNSEAEASDHDCASFADNEDNQESPLIGTYNTGTCIAEWSRQSKYFQQQPRNHKISSSNKNIFIDTFLPFRA